MGFGQHVRSWWNLPRWGNRPQDHFWFVGAVQVPPLASLLPTILRKLFSDLPPFENTAGKPWTSGLHPWKILESEGQSLVLQKQSWYQIILCFAGYHGYGYVDHILFSISKQTKGFNYHSKFGDGIHQQRRLISTYHIWPMNVISVYIYIHMYVYT